MRKDHIEDKELLYRAIPNKPSHWKAAFNKPTTALFKDFNGVSIDRDGSRMESEITSNFRSRKPNFGLLKLVAGRCRTIPTNPIPKPETENDFHGEIHDSDEKVVITARSKQRELVKCSELVYKPDSVN